MSEILSVPPHRISGQMLAALATGGGGAAAVRQLAAAQYSKHLLLVWAVRDTARRTRHPQASHACRGYDLLAEVQRGAPDAVEAVLRHPSTGAWAARALRSLLGEQEPGGPRRARPGGEPAQLAALAAAAAIRARHPCAIDVPVCRGAVTLPSVGQITLSPGWMAAGGSAAGDGSAAAGLAGVRYTVEGIRLIAGRRFVHIPADTRTDTPGWRGLHQLRATERGMTLRLVLDDLDPDRMPSARDLGGRLSPAEATRWQRILPQAWDLLADLPGTAAEEIHAAVRVLTPLRRPAHGQVSTSSREAFGGVALSPPADALALAVSLAQEAQHAKLGALLDLVTLTRPDDGQRYGAPWCDHPRCADAWCEEARRDGGRCDAIQPAGALLRRAYGCLGVSGFWRWQCQAEDRVAAARARMEFRRWREAAATATRVLAASGRLTRPGRMFVAGMAATLQAWGEDEVPGAAPPRAQAGPGLPRDQLAISGPGVRMRDETTAASGGAPPPGRTPRGVPAAGIPPGGALAAGVTAVEAAVSSVIAGGELRSHLPDLAGRPLGDLRHCGRARLATAARRIVTQGGDQVTAGRVVMRYTKWGGIAHWRFELEPLGQDEFGWWFFGRKGLIQQRGDKPPVLQPRDFVLLVPAEGCWTAYFNAEDDMEIYVDVTTRPVLDGDTVTAVDLDLDVVRFFDGRVEVLDEDEFAEHQVQLAYPAELISQARATCDWLVGAVSSRAEPFGRAGPAWLARARGGA